MRLNQLYFKQGDHIQQKSLPDNPYIELRHSFYFKSPSNNMHTAC